MSDRPEEQLSLERIDDLRQQETLYEQMKPDLLNQYDGEFVVFENGVVLHHDRDDKALLRRVYQQQGYRDLLIRQVLLHEPRFSVGGAFTAASEQMSIQHDPDVQLGERERVAAKHCPCFRRNQRN